MTATAPSPTSTESPKAADAPAAPKAFPPAVETMRNRLLGAVPFKLFLWLKLPLAAFAGLRVRTADPTTCTVSLPAGWRTRNPFGSVYFAAHAMAAEMSTGALVLLHAAAHGENAISTLVGRVQATYSKAAKSEVVYRCEDGAKIAAALEKAMQTGEAQEIATTTRGTSGGEVCAEFQIVWSVKRRSKR